MFNESIKMAIDGMISNKLRTLLTLLGIIIGVGAVIAMVSLGFGVKEQIKDNISRLGSNFVVINEHRTIQDAKGTIQVVVIACDTISALALFQQFRL